MLGLSMMTMLLAATPIQVNPDGQIAITQQELRRLHKRDLQLDVCVEYRKTLTSQVQMLEDEIRKPPPQPETPGWVTVGVGSLLAGAIVGVAVGLAL